MILPTHPGRNPANTAAKTSFICSSSASFRGHRGGRVARTAAWFTASSRADRGMRAVAEAASPAGAGSGFFSGAVPGADEAGDGGGNTRGKRLATKSSALKKPRPKTAAHSSPIENSLKMGTKV